LGKKKYISGKNQWKKAQCEIDRSRRCMTYNKNADDIGAYNFDYEIALVALIISNFIRG